MPGFGKLDLQDQYDGVTGVRRETGCGRKAHVLPLVMPRDGGHLWVEMQAGDYVAGEVVQMMDADEVHLGCVHQLQERNGDKGELCSKHIRLGSLPARQHDAGGDA